MQYLVLVARMAEINYKVITAYSHDVTSEVVICYSNSKKAKQCKLIHSHYKYNGKTIPAYFIKDRCT